GGGNAAKAREYFERALADSPKDPNARQNLALLLAKDARFAEADKLWGAVTVDSPSFIAARLSWAESLAARGQRPAAIRQYQEVLHLDPTWAGAHEPLARLYFENGD